MEHIQRIHALYVGNVQGVGFRFAAKRIACRMDVKGYVKNLSNGNVEVIGEGDRERLKAFLGGMKEDMREYIRDCHVEWQSPSNEFGSFEIKF